MGLEGRWFTARATTRWLAAATALASSPGCYTESVTRSELRGTPVTRTEPVGGGSTFAVTSESTSGGIRLSLRPARCSTSSVTHVAVRETVVKQPSVVASVVMGVIAVGSLAGSYVEFKEADQSSSATDSCTKDDQGKESCSSPAGRARAIGVVLGLTGLGFGAAAIWWPTTGELREVNERGARDEAAPARVDACAVKLAGVELSLRLASGDVIAGTTDEHGAVTLPISDELLERNAEHADATVLRGAEELGRASIQSLLAARGRAARRAGADVANEARQRADATVVWGGALRGDVAGGTLVTSCKPSGEERCFDAIDNDCNGAYDDAQCGYASGVLQWTLAWQGAADFDLHVVGPDGGHVFYQSPRWEPTKLVLDRDCKGISGGVADCPDGNIENVYVPSDETPVPGTYIAWVELYALNDAASADPISVRLGGRLGGRTWYDERQVAPTAGATYRFAFANGPDADGDAIIDAEDGCPNDVGPWSANKAARGCPDADHDLVADKDDACPAEPGLTQTESGKNGCPLKFGDARVTNLGIEIQATIEFDTSRHRLKASGRRIVADVARAIKARPGSVKKLAVDGHTDDRGDPRKNYKLSADRAAEVSQELVRDGVDAGLLMSRGFGQYAPRASNATEEGRKLNRRVEFNILERDTVPQGQW